MMGVSHYIAFNKLSSEVMTAVLGIYNDNIKPSSTFADSLEHHVRILEVLQKLSRHYAEQAPAINKIGNKSYYLFIRDFFKRNEFNNSYSHNFSMI